MGGGGGGQNTATTQNSSAFIPKWLEGYGMEAVQRADVLSQQAYNPYTGQTVAGLDPAQQQAYNQVAAMQGMGQQGFASGINAQGRLADAANPLTAAGIQGDTNTFQQGFNQNVYQPAEGLLGGFASQGPMTAQGVASNAQQLMSPYMSSVLDPANQLMQQQLRQNLNQIGAAANSAGAFGGSRQGVQEGIAQSQAALGSQKYLGDLLNNQWGQALTAGGQIANQNAAQGLAANTTLADLMRGGYGASQQAAGNLANQNMQAGLNAAQQLPGSMTAYQNAMLGQANALNQAGGQMQGYQQNILNQQQAGFAQQQAFPYQQLQTLLGAISGIPYSTSYEAQSSENTPYYSNPWGQATGGLAALGGLAGGVGSILNKG